MISENINTYKKEIRTYLATALFVLLFLCCVMLKTSIHNMGRSYETQDTFQVLTDSGFYDEEVIIEVSVPEGQRVFYSLNDYLPDEESGILYTEPIMIEPRDDDRLYNINFVSISDTGEHSDYIYKTYFVGKNIKSRFDTMVLSVYGDPDGLFGYENGIFVTGKDYDDFIEENDPEDYVYSLHFANYMREGREAERPVHAEFFLPSGEKKVDINCGLRIKGASSRIKQQKSFKLFARYEYDELQNKIRYPFFDNLIKGDGGVFSSFKHIVVRNAGGDNGYGYIRNELLCSLINEEDIIDTIDAVPVTVFLNGEYAGIYWLESDLDGSYFKDKYTCDDKQGDFAVFKGGDLSIHGNEYKEYADKYNEKMAELVEYDYNEEESQKELENLIDTDNYLMFFAVEYFTGNTDFPTNNVTAFRYISADDNYIPGSVYDGRYRYAIYDLDETLGYAYDEDMRLLEGIAHEVRSKLFMKMLECNEYRDRFINDVCDIMNYRLSPDKIDEKLMDMHTEREDELRYMLDETELNKVYDLHDRWTVFYEFVDNEIVWISEAAHKRPDRIVANMQDYLELGDTYYLDVNIQDGSSRFKVNSIVCREDMFSGRYFEEVPVVLSPILSTNEEFECWMVNGEQFFDSELIIDENMIVEGHVDVELVTKSSETPRLSLKTVKAKGGNDFIELVNNSDSITSTEGYYLSDNEDRYMYKLPGVILKPGETLRIYCKDYSKSDGLGGISCNFDIKEGETISLSRNSELLESVYIPSFTFEDGVYEKDFLTDRFVERRSVKETDI